MEIHEMVIQLIGEISPVGETYTDKERYMNLLKYATVADTLICKLIEAAQYKDRAEYSMSRIGGEAYEQLHNLAEYINNNLED